MGGAAVRPRRGFSFGWGLRNLRHWGVGEDGGELPDHALTLNGKALTLNGKILTLASSGEGEGDEEMPVITLVGTEMIITNFTASASPLEFKFLGLTSLVMSELVNCASFVKVDIDTLTSIDISNVELVGGYLDIFCDALTNLDLSALVTVGQEFDIQAVLLETLDCSALVSAGNGFSVQGGNLTSVGCSALVDCGTGGFYMRGQANLAALNTPLLENVGGVVNIGNTTTLVTLNMPALKRVSGDVYVDGAALNQASVDALLVQLAAMDGTGGTTSYDNHAIDLSGGTSASPGVTGLAAKVTLEGRGNTVTVN